MKPTISIIVTTYNYPIALELILLALAEQEQTISYEVIIADDGSNKETALMLEKLSPKLPYQLLHVWQSDDGFRAAVIRNKAVAKARGEYLIFLDGDCVPRSSFVKTHWRLAEKGWLVGGNRILLTKKFTAEVLQQKILLHHWTLIDWLIASFQKKCNRFLPALTLPLVWLRKINAKKWRGVKSCNLAIWRKDFLAVNGFDESYIGWGYEDSDLVIRLIRNNIFHKSGKFAAPVIHLWHQEVSRGQEKENYIKLMNIQQADQIFAVKGVDQY